MERDLRKEIQDHQKRLEFMNTELEKVKQQQKELEKENKKLKEKLGLGEVRLTSVEIWSKTLTDYDEPRTTNDGTELNLEHTQIPLPDGGDWLTVIIRPRKGLNLATWTTPKVAEGINMACQPPTTEHVRTLRLRIDPVQNIAIASTPNEELAMSIRHITTIHMGVLEFAVTAYVADPDSSAKGVIHGIPAGTSTEVLLNGLYVPDLRGSDRIHWQDCTLLRVITVVKYAANHTDRRHISAASATKYATGPMDAQRQKSTCASSVVLETPLRTTPATPGALYARGPILRLPRSLGHAQVSDGSVPAPGRAPARRTNRERPGTPVDLLRRDHKR
ncbi:hypothetical protein HPB49_009894 [Dermacentor silvarum]|uniref:Uncharacterized protein n=1 Tax=Dermacentor silvarum TaxID=543639 RepID=A0ACB8DCJ9_DERSI|nr:hypothetical protein HPB49_009894 [Dermacentor silvarum]